jgi:hypothetical protein
MNHGSPPCASPLIAATLDCEVSPRPPVILPMAHDEPIRTAIGRLHRARLPRLEC